MRRGVRARFTSLVMALLLGVAAAVLTANRLEPASARGRIPTILISTPIDLHRARQPPQPMPPPAPVPPPTSAGAAQTPSPLAAPAPTLPVPRYVRVYLTGYSFLDNTPPRSAVVSHPVLHHLAGGQGTYDDPITVAVPGQGPSMRWRPGTLFYLPTIRRYVIVEDSGASPAPPGVDTHLDVWIGGETASRAATEACMSRLTGVVSAIVHPPPGLAVLPGPIFAGSTCRLPILAVR